LHTFVPPSVQPTQVLPMKRNMLTAIAVSILFMNSSCVEDVKDALDETADSLRCADLVREFENRNDANPDRNCTDIVSELDEIENSCSEFLSDSVKEQFQVLRDACANGG